MAVADALGRDGNVHIVDQVLVPPKKVVEGATEWDEWNEELTVEDLKERLAAWVEDDQDDYDEGMELWAHAFDL